MQEPQRPIVMIENILVGVFGAFVGGEFLANMVGASVATQSFHMVPRVLALAVSGAITLLLMLS